jgi:hypothetical protein
MDGEAQFIWGVIFGIFGLGFFSYGKKQQAIVPLFTGIALFIFPYFVSNLYLLVGIGIGLMALPFLLRI